MRRGFEEYLPEGDRERKFQNEFHRLLKDYVGRPSPLYYAKRLSEKYGAKIYLKREDLNHTGAHKINNTIGQILIARAMGKKRIIAETGAGQHGVAAATVAALMDMDCVVYMGKTDVERQHPNVQRMEMLGAKVVPVTSGNMTLKDATNEAIRDWCCHPEDTYYIIGSTVGPHPYPDMVARLQSVISAEIKEQLKEKEGRDYPDYLMACVGGGSNAAGTIYHYLDDERVRSYSLKQEVKASSPERVPQRSISEEKALSTAHAHWSCRMKMDRSKNPSLFRQVWTIQASDRCTPISLLNIEPPF